jgi:hypothetical protein
MLPFLRYLFLIFLADYLVFSWKFFALRYLFPQQDRLLIFFPIPVFTFVFWGERDRSLKEMSSCVDVKLINLQLENTQESISAFSFIALQEPICICLYIMSPCPKYTPSSGRIVKLVNAFSMTRRRFYLKLLFSYLMTSGHLLLNVSKTVILQKANLECFWWVVLIQLYIQYFYTVIHTQFCEKNKETQLIDQWLTC